LPVRPSELTGRAAALAEFPMDRGGNRGPMIGVALAAIVAGIVMTFFLPWVGIPVGTLGLILLVLYLAGWGRRAAQSQP
jgi:hypothetical protein